MRNHTLTQETLSLDGSVTLGSALEADALPLAQLKDELAAAGVNARVHMGAGGATVFMRRDRRFTRREQYRLEITPGGIHVIAATDAGAYYGIQTLRDLVRMHGKQLPCGRIDDWPTFARRSVYLDCSRGKVPTVETVKQMIEWLSHWKLNELQLYIENVFTFEKHPEIGKGFSPFTPDDIRQIQAHAKAHHVNFVPSLSSFGHFEKILMLPQYQDLGELPGSRGMPGGTTLNPNDPRSIELIRDLYDDFLPLFEAEDFNVCCDEPFDLGLGRSKARADREGLGRVFLDFVLKLREQCHRHNKRINIWGDLVMHNPEVLPDLPKDVCVTNWDYATDGRRIWRCNELRDAGLAFVGATGAHTGGAHGSRLERSLTNVSMFARTAREQEAEGLMVTDWGGGGHRHALASALCAHTHCAAHGWCSEHVDDDRHVERFCDIVFGDPQGHFAQMVRTLGEFPIRADQPCWSMQERLIESSTPLAEGTHIYDGFRLDNVLSIDKVEATPEQVAEREKTARAIRVPQPTRTLSPFEQLAVDEYAMEARMEAVCAQRLNLALRLRRGEPVEADELEQHAQQLEAIAGPFEKSWLARNRPSRLCDNLALFEAGAAEARELASKSKHTQAV